VRQPSRHLLPGAHPLEKLDAGAAPLHLGQHAIEPARQVGELVVALLGYAHVQVPAGDRLRRLGEHADPDGDALGQQGAEPDRHDDGDGQDGGERIENPRAST